VCHGGARRAAGLNLDGISDMVPTWRSLTVHFDPLRLPHEQLAPGAVAGGGARVGAGDTAIRHADDRAGVLRRRVRARPCRSRGRHRPQRGELIAALCAVDLQVALIGFLPGFPYLGGLPDWLDLPRRATPRTAVPANSFAIAGGQAAIYPWQSPGGWHLLGRTPLTLFDPANPQRPARFAPGDVLRIEAISADEFTELRERLRHA
jgi:allophanate hydrolase subunit 1